MRLASHLSISSELHGKVWHFDPRGWLTHQGPPLRIGRGYDAKTCTGSGRIRLDPQRLGWGAGGPSVTSHLKRVRLTRRPGPVPRLPGGLSGDRAIARRRRFTCPAALGRASWPACSLQGVGSRVHPLVRCWLDVGPPRLVLTGYLLGPCATGCDGPPRLTGPKAYRNTRVFFRVGPLSRTRTAGGDEARRTTCSQRQADSAVDAGGSPGHDRAGAHIHAVHQPVPACAKLGSWPEAAE